jgi:hypothetical protein
MKEEEQKHIKLNLSEKKEIIFRLLTFVRRACLGI